MIDTFLLVLLFKINKRMSDRVDNAAVVLMMNEQIDNENVRKIMNILVEKNRPSKTIEYNKNSIRLMKILLNILKDSKQKINYWNDREIITESGVNFKNALERGIELLSYVLQPGDKIKSCSSYSAGIHLKESDVDIFLLINDKDDKKEKYYVDFLIANGFKHEATIHDGDYKSYNKLIDGVELEIKIRDKAPAADIVLMHEYIEALSPDDKKSITYIKSICNIYKEPYLTFKMIMYSAYYTMMMDEKKKKSLTV